MNPAFLPRALTSGLVALMAALTPLRAETLDKVSFGTNWVAEAEHGGFFQAVADGTYAKYGLEVTIVPGPRWRSIVAYSSRLTARSSKTASITQSAA